MEKEKEFDIKIETQEDATRFARLGAWAGFIWAFVTTALALLIMFLAKEKIVEGMAQSAAEADKPTPVAAMVMGMLAAVIARFILYWFLSWRTYTGRAYISGTLLFLVYVAEIGFMLLNMFKSTPVMTIVISIPFILIGYVFWAGVRGSWATRKFRKTGYVDATAF